LLNLKWRLTKAFFTALICAAAFGLTACLVSYQRLAGLDNAVIRVVQGMQSPWLTGVMKFFTFIGAGLPAIVISTVIMIILYFFFRHRRELLLFVWVGAGSALLNLALKLIFHRPRPELHRIINTTGYSFPSGHAMAAFSLYGVVAYLIWRHIRTRWGRGIFLLFSAVMIVAIGVSRIYLGVHYPSDVLGGYMASGFWLALSIWFFQRKQVNR
jgi:undecaprenyl-diphosphatase